MIGVINNWAKQRSRVARSLDRDSSQRVAASFRNLISFSTAGLNDIFFCVRRVEWFQYTAAGGEYYKSLGSGVLEEMFNLRPPPSWPSPRRAITCPRGAKNHHPSRQCFPFGDKSNSIAERMPRVHRFLLGWDCFLRAEGAYSRLTKISRPELPTMKFSSSDKPGWYLRSETIGASHTGSLPDDQM